MSNSIGRCPVPSPGPLPRLATPILLVAALLAVASGAGCQSRPPLSAFHWLDPAADVPGPAVPEALARDGYRDLRAELRPGDVIMGARTDPTSALMRLAMDEYSYYTHSGIVDVRDGEVVVSHASGRFRLFRRSPHLLGKVVGTVAAIDLEDFIREYHDVRVVRLPDPVKNRRLVAIARACEAKELPFDPFFDTLDPFRLHCSEYTLRATRAAGYGGPVDLARRTPNHSMANLLRRLGVETDYFVNVDRFAAIPGATVVAEISRFDRPETATALVEAFRVMHERVCGDPDMHVRDLVGCSPERLMHFTPPAEVYLRGAIGLAEASPTRDPLEVRERSELLYDLICGERVQSTSAAETLSP